MGHQSRRNRSVPKLSLGRQIQTAREYDAQRFGLTPTPTGEQRIIGTQRAATDDHSIHLAPQLMDPSPCRRAADPLAGAIGQGRTPINTHGPLQDPPGLTGLHTMQKSPVLLNGQRTQNTRDHLDSGVAQLSDSATSHPRVWILQCDHNASKARADHRLTTRGGTAVMAAGFECDHKGAAAG